MPSLPITTPFATVRGHRPLRVLPKQNLLTRAAHQMMRVSKLMRSGSQQAPGAFRDWIIVLFKHAAVSSNADTI